MVTAELWFEKALAKKGSVGIGKLYGVAHVGVKGAVGCGNDVESGPESLRFHGHDRFYASIIQGFGKAKNLLQLRPGAFQAVRSQQISIGKQIVLDDGVARHAQDGEQNSAEYTGAILAGSAV